MPPRAPASAPRARWYGRQRRQSGTSRLRFFFQRDLHVENCPLPRLAFNADVASEQGHALAQAHQAESIRPARIVEIEAAAVVPDVQRHGTVGAPERDFDALCLGVPGDVGERLLQDAEYRGGVRILEFEIRRADDQLARSSRAMRLFSCSLTEFMAYASSRSSDCERRSASSARTRSVTSRRITV